MKNLAISMIMISVMASAQAAQTLRPLTNGTLFLAEKTLIAKGLLNNKEKSAKINFLQIEGSVAGLECGRDNCFATVSVNAANEIFLNAKIDTDNDGNIDATERTYAGTLVGNQLNFILPLEFTYVIQRYSIVERMLGLKNSEYISVTVGAR